MQSPAMQKDKQIYCSFAEENGDDFIAFFVKGKVCDLYKLTGIIILQQINGLTF